LTNSKTPSELNRGEGTEAEYYILKIDLCNSTLFFLRRSLQTYFKITHVFLSTVDDITRIFGADAKQVEYAGDSVMAYFPNNDGIALEVLKAAYWVRLATIKMKTLDQTFSQFPFKTRTVVHYGKLILGNIGPWGDYNLTAMGMPLHVVAKLEKNIKPGNGLATKEFGAKLATHERKNFLTGNYIETKIEIPSTQAFTTQQPASNPNLGIGLLSNYLRSEAFTITDIMYPTQPAIVAQPRYEIKQELMNYDINWLKLQRYLEKGDQV